jgi:oligopeptidase A
MNPTNPLFNTEIVTTGKVDYALITPEHFREALDYFLEISYDEHEEDMNDPEISYHKLFEEKYSYSAHLGEIWGILDILLGVRDSAELRAVYEEFLPKIQKFYYETSQKDTRPYEHFMKFLESEEAENLSEIKYRQVNKVMRAYIDRGIELSDEEKEKLQAVDEKLASLCNTFSKNCNESDNTKVLTFQLDELDGLNETQLNKARELAEQAGEQGYRFTLSDGNMFDILTYCENEHTRKTVYNFTNDSAKHGEFDNKQIVHDIAKAKQERAKILGYKNFASFNLKDKMAKDQNRVLDFVNDLGNKAIFAAKSDRKLVEQYGEKLLNKPKLNFWDRGYVANIYEKEKFSIDHLKIQKYFTFDTALNGLFSILGDMFNLSFKDSIAAGNSTEEEKWHPDVIIYDVYEGDEYIGKLITDFFKRANKSDGAWMNPIHTYHKFDDGTEDPTVAHIVCNFPKSAQGKPQTISHYNLTTLFHEFGHGVHELLSKVEKGSLGGSHVQWDGVELPSQFMENFCWDYDYLLRLTAHETTSEVLPKDLFDKMYAAKNYGAAGSMIRQVVLSEMDMLTYTQEGEVRSPMDIEQEIRMKWATGEQDPDHTMMQEFGHIFCGGYSAGYYSYKWAEVLSADAYAAVKKEPTLIQKYKTEILETGNSRDMMDNFVAFLGREPSVDALLIDCGLIQGE